MTVQSIHAGWRLYNDFVTDALGAMSTDELPLCALSGDPTSSAGWPIWAIAGHTAARGSTGWEHRKVRVMPAVVKGDPGTPAPERGTTRRARVAGKQRSIVRRALRAAWRVIWDDTGGIDETALPSGFTAPQRRGSRQVRNLWHIPF
jgi:hypothetical protein